MGWKLSKRLPSLFPPIEKLSIYKQKGFLANKKQSIQYKDLEVLLSR
jgi:hypothetical protein